MEEQLSDCRPAKPSSLWAILAISFLVTTSSLAVAANFGVSPIRLDFDRSARTGAVTVTNDDVQKPLRLQVEALSWTQDADGKDHYGKTAELTFLPAIMTIPPSEQRLLRAGIRVPAADREKAYRLFVEEVPDAGNQPAPGAQVAVKVRFGIPVFAKPLKEEPRGEIEQAHLGKGGLTVIVKNTGNVHFQIESVQLRGDDGFSRELPGWYLFPGAARAHTAQIPPDACAKLGSLNVTVKTDRLELTRRISVEPAMCQ